MNLNDGDIHGAAEGLSGKYLIESATPPDWTSDAWDNTTGSGKWKEVTNIGGFNYYWTTSFMHNNELINPKKEGIEMKGLYEVIGVYGEDRNNVIFHRPEKSFVIASSEEDAKMKSGIYGWIDEKWDADYLTIIVRKIGDVAVKEKPKEVKNV